LRVAMIEVPAVLHSLQNGCVGVRDRTRRRVPAVRRERLTDHVGSNEVPILGHPIARPDRYRPEAMDDALDTLSDKNALEGMLVSGKVPWKIW
jgi:hypothetical protein